MPEIDKEFIREKIKLAGDYLDEIKEFLKTDDRAIYSDLKSRYSLERVFLLLAEELIDINNYFVKTLELKPIEDLKSSFLALGEVNILPLDFAQKISPLVGVRNILVHQYEKLDFNLFLKNLRTNLGDFEVYFRHILTYIEKS
mgnify:CR=1 FL=1